MFLLMNTQIPSFYDIYYTRKMYIGKEIIKSKKAERFIALPYSNVSSSNFNNSTTAWALPFTPSFNITFDI